MGTFYRQSVTDIRRGRAGAARDRRPQDLHPPAPRHRPGRGRGLVHIDVGETVGIVGESGCGKTMTGMSIISLLPAGRPYRRVGPCFEGRDLTKISDREIRDVRGNQVAVIFQDPMTSLNPTMTSDASRRAGRAPPGHASRGRLAASRGGARPRRHARRRKSALEDYPHQLSGGLRQRAMIAMALACEPPAADRRRADDRPRRDHPSADPRALGRPQARLGMAMILITHDLGVIAGRADEVVVMYAGKIVEQAATLDLFQGTRHPYTEALLESIPRSARRPTSPSMPSPAYRPTFPTRRRAAASRRAASYTTVRCQRRGADARRRPAPTIPLPASIPSGAERRPLVAGPHLRHRASCALEQVLARRLSHYGAGPPTTASRPFPCSFAPTMSPRRSSLSPPATVFQRKVGTIKAVSGRLVLDHRGETFGLVGESGCGKTTLGRMITVLERLSAGRILFCGEGLAHAPRPLRAAGTSARPAAPCSRTPTASLDPASASSTIIREPLAIQHYRLPRAESERVAELLREVGLSASVRPSAIRTSSPVVSASASVLPIRARPEAHRRRRAGLGASDVSVRSQILNLMKRFLQATHNLTYIVISHDLSVVRYLADRIGVMYLWQARRDRDRAGHCCGTAMPTPTRPGS